jgi:hypothetical protein
MSYRQKPVRRGDVIDVYMNHKLSDLKVNTNVNNIRDLLIGSVPDADIDDRIKELLGPEGETEFDVP